MQPSTKIRAGRVYFLKPNGVGERKATTEGWPWRINLFATTSGTAAIYARQTAKVDVKASLQTAAVNAALGKAEILHAGSRCDARGLPLSRPIFCFCVPGGFSRGQRDLLSAHNRGSVSIGRAIEFLEFDGPRPEKTMTEQESGCRQWH
jgi:hypothetical protein